MTHRKNLVVASLLLPVYFFIAYFLKRTDTCQIFVLVALVGSGYAFLIRRQISADNYPYLVGLAFVLRLAFLFSTPALSDDFYRFIWDGSLIQKGINPFAYLPDELMRKGLVTGEYYGVLLQNMNSPRYYSIYPPVLQLLFFISVKCSFGAPLMAIIYMRLFILLSELGTFIFLKRILKLLNLPKERIFLYLLNPLVIVELTGNLHFEGVMIFFFTASLYLLLLDRITGAATLFALAVSAKVIPLIFLPLIIRKLGIKKGLGFSILVGGISVALFLPFANRELASHLGRSFGLYFSQFELNGSIYYVLKWLGEALTGENVIYKTGIMLPILSSGIILWLAVRLKSTDSWEDVLEKALAALFTYYLFSSVVHPWYITCLVLLSVLVRRNYALVWSGLVFMSYAHYAAMPYRENGWLIALEYGIVVGLFWWEHRLNAPTVRNIRH